MNPQMAMMPGYDPNDVRLIPFGGFMVLDHGGGALVLDRGASDSAIHSLAALVRGALVVSVSHSLFNRQRLCHLQARPFIR